MERDFFFFFALNERAGLEEFLVEALRLACKCLERIQSNGGEVCTWMDSMLFAVSQSQPTRSDIIFLS